MYCVDPHGPGYVSIAMLEVIIFKFTYAGVPTHMMLSIRDMCWNDTQHHAPSSGPFTLSC